MPTDPGSEGLSAHIFMLGQIVAIAAWWRHIVAIVAIWFGFESHQQRAMLYTKLTPRGLWFLGSTA